MTEPSRVVVSSPSSPTFRWMGSPAMREASAARRGIDVYIGDAGAVAAKVSSAGVERRARVHPARGASGFERSLGAVTTACA